MGGMLSYPIAYLVMGNKAAALFTFVVPFLISTCGGTLIAIVITASLKKTGVLGRMQAQLGRIRNVISLGVLRWKKIWNRCYGTI